LAYNPAKTFKQDDTEDTQNTRDELKKKTKSRKQLRKEIGERIENKGGRDKVSDKESLEVKKAEILIPLPLVVHIQDISGGVEGDIMISPSMMLRRSRNARNSHK